MTSCAWCNRPVLIRRSERFGNRIVRQFPVEVRLPVGGRPLVLTAALAGFCLLGQVLPAAEPDAAATAQAASRPKGSLSVHSPDQRAEWQKRLTLGPGDVLNLSLYGYPELSKANVAIGPDGRISFLQAQDIMATGLTVDELRAKLDQELARYYRNPRTVIIPVAYQSKKFVILGKVTRKGVYTLDRPLTVIEAVAQAGGFETGLFEGNVIEMADLPRSFLVRGEEKLPVDFERLFQQGDLSQNVPLEPGDYLYFPSANANEVYILGQVGSPGVNAFLPKMTAVSAITIRGGFTERAYRQRVLVVRGSLNQPQAYVVNVAAILAGKQPDFPLEPKDILYVSEKPWAKAEDLLHVAISSFVRGAVVSAANVYLYDIQRLP